MQTVDIQAFTYEPRHTLLADLTTVLSNCGGWILERNTLPHGNVSFRVEVQLRSTLDLYAAIVSTGVELTRSGHEALTELCSRHKHMLRPPELGQVIVLRLEIAFLADVTLHALLSARAGLA